MKLGRNDFCFCGSGKKYKKCCMNKSMDMNLIFKEKLNKIHTDIKNKEKIESVISYTYNFFMKHEWEGACHALSAIQYILLNEIGIDSKICIGIVRKDNYIFDHSWIEIDGKVYDIAVANGLDGIKISSPVVRGIDIGTLEETTLKYGIDGSLDYPASIIKDLDICEYIDGASSVIDLKDGLWGVIVEFLNEYKVVEIPQLRMKYRYIKRNVV